MSHLHIDKSDHLNRKPKDSSNDHRAQLGVQGEEIAAHYLRAEGYEIESQNWRGQSGELDLVVYQDDLLIIIEVRSISTDWLQRPTLAIPPSKQRQVARCADEYLRVRPHNAPVYQDVRFDVLGIYIPLSGAPTIDHVEDAFHSPWMF